MIEKYFWVSRELQNWERNKGELLKTGKKGYRIGIESLGLNSENLALLEESLQQSAEVVIADIDQDGFLLSHFGPIENAPTVSKEQFLPRKRFHLEVVAINGYIGIKKDYKGNKFAFLNEIKALHNFRLTNCNVPAIIDVNFDKVTLTLSCILGPVLRESLAQKGAILRDRDVSNNPDFISLCQKEKKLKRIQEGRRVLYEVIDSQFAEDLFAELNKIHTAGFILHDMKYGNIIMEKETGKSYLIDFDYASYLPNLGKNFSRILRNRDIEKFNLLFSTEKLTYKIMKKKIRDNNVYAPIYFGAGLRMGNIWGIDTGYGRWHYILKHNLPSLSGKRILDLGANNAFTSLQMLRQGAQEVIGIELDSKYIAQGNFVKSGFEWADNKQYNFRYIQGNMKEISNMDLGKFDFVIALCSLYYLDDESIANLAQHISTITDIFVLQANIATNIDRSDPYTYKKASVEYALNVLRDNGFSLTQVIAPYKYTRPLIIGKKPKMQ